MTPFVYFHGLRPAWLETLCMRCIGVPNSTLPCDRSPSLPTAPRLLRDIGLPESHTEPAIYSPFGQKL